MCRGARLSICRCCFWFIAHVSIKGSYCGWELVHLFDPSVPGFIMRVIELLTPDILRKHIGLDFFSTWLNVCHTSPPDIYVLYNETPFSHLVSCFIAVVIRLPASYLMCMCCFVWTRSFQRSTSVARAGL